MKKTEITKLINTLPKNHDQEAWRIIYAETALKIYQMLEKQQIEADEAVHMAEELKTRCPDKKDRIIAEVTGWLDDMILEPYSCLYEIEYLAELVQRIKTGIRYAQAPALLAHYDRREDGKLVEGIVVMIINDGFSARVRKVQNPVCEKLTELFNGKEISRSEIKKQLPQRIGNFQLSRSALTIAGEEINY